MLPNAIQLLNGDGDQDSGVGLSGDLVERGDFRESRFVRHIVRHGERLAVGNNVSRKRFWNKVTVPGGEKQRA